ncbi:hypothetical protein JCM8202v2_002170 [Rhodotorula sphaerocarpa]
MADEIEEPSPPLPGKVLAARYDLARREGLLDPRPDHAIPKPPPQHDRKKGAARRGPVAFERFLYSGFRLKVVFIDVSESGRRARAMRGETTKLGSEMIPVWNEATQSYDPVSRHNPHLLHVGPGEALVLVDAENPAHYDFKAAAPTGSFLRRTSTSSEVPARHRLVASEVTEAYARLLAMGDASPWQVRVRPPGTLPRERVERVARAVGIHELMALLDPNGNQKGSRSHTSGQTAIHMSYGTMLQPSPIWTHDDDKSLSPLSDDVAAARTIFAEAKAYAAEMSRLRGSVSVRLNELLLPPSDFAMLKARAHRSGSLRHGSIDNFTTTTTQHNVLPFADLVGSSAPSAAPHSSASAPPVPSAVEMPVQGAVFTLNGLGKLFGMPHIDDGDEPLLFTHLYPERSLPRGSTFGSFLLTGEDDFTIPIISGDSSHVGTEVAVNAVAGRPLEGGRMMAVNYATSIGTRTPPPFPLDARSLLLDARHARVPILSRETLASSRGLESIGNADVYDEWVFEEFQTREDVAVGAPGQMPEPLKTINAFAAYARPAFDDAARHVEALRPWADTLRYRARQEGVDEQFFSDAVAFAPHSAFDLAVPCTHGLFPPPVDVGAPVETCEACLREPLRVSLADVFEAEARAERFRNHLRDACEMSKEFRGLGDYPASRVTPRPPVEHFKLAAVPLRPALIASADLDVQDPCLERYSNAAFASVDLELRPRESAEAYAVEQAAVTRFCHERDAMLMAYDHRQRVWEAHLAPSEGVHDAETCLQVSWRWPDAEAKPGNTACRDADAIMDDPFVLSLELAPDHDPAAAFCHVALWASGRGCTTAVSTGRKPRRKHPLVARRIADVRFSSGSTPSIVPPAGNSQPAAHNNGASPGGSSKGWGEVPPASADALMAAVSHCAALDDASGARATVNRARMYAQLSVLAVHLDHVVWPRCLSEAEAAMRRISPLYSTEGPSPPTLSVDEATCVQYLEASSASKPTFLASTVAPGRGWLLYRRGHATVLDTPKGVRRALFELALLRFEWDLLELLQPSQLLVSAPPEDADVPEDLLLTGSLRQPPFPVVGGGASVSIATATAAFVGGVRSVLTLLLLAIRRGDRQGLLLLTPALHDALRDPLAFTRTTRRVHPNETRHQFPAGMWDAALDDFADPDVLASCNAALSCLFEASPADAASLASCFELRDRLVLLPYGTNPSWSEHGGELSTFLVVGLFYAKEVHRTHLPFDPRACPALVDIFDRLESTAAGRALRQEIHERLDGHAAEWGIWLKDLHPINVYAAPDLKRQVEAGSLQTGTTASRRALIRRVAFTVFCLRGCVGGLAPATLRLVPAEGWKDETEFNAWFSSQAVSADRDERGARWEDKRVYGTATAMNPRHAGTYSKNIELILKFLDKPSSSTPTFETTVRFLRGAKSDKRKAFPQVGGPLTSLHVASDLANFGLVRHCDVDEMAPLVKALDLGAAAGLRALGLTTHGRTLEAAFCEFAGRINCDWADGGLDSSFRAFMTQNKFSLSARNIENLLCKAVRAEFDFRSKPSHVAVYTALPTLFNAKRWPENTTLAGSTDGLEAETPSAERRRDGSKKRGAPMPLSASSSSSSLSSSSSSSSTRGKGHPAGKRHRRE